MTTQISKTPAASAMKVANYLIWHSQKHGDAISNLKLQKILYYAHGWYLAINRRVLFSEPVEAWVRGPVVRSVWREYSHHAWKPINEAISEPALTVAVKEHLDEVMAVYGDFSAYSLERFTHRETPWIKARGDLLPDTSSSREISTEEIFAYFSKLATRKN